MNLPEPAGIERVLVLRLGALGDVVLCEPAVSAIADRYPTAELSFVTRAPYHLLYAAHPQVHSVVAPAQAPAHADLAVDLHNRLDTRRLALRARHRVHWRKRQGTDLLFSALGRPLHRSYRGGPHQVERIATSLCLTTRRAPRVHLDPAWRAAAQASAPEGSIVLLPAASRSVKQWSPGRFARCAEDLVRRGHQVLVAGGPREDGLLASVAGRCATALPGSMTLGLLGAVFERAAVVVGNDTGLAHLAAAVGTPVVVLFGPTPPGRWGPSADRGEVVTLDPACGPCSDHGARPCRKARRACLDDLETNAVVAAVERILTAEQRQNAPPSQKLRT